MITREPVPSQPGKVRVTFSLPASIWADQVRLVGDFNGWNTASTPLRRDEQCWSISVLLDKGCTYAYRYLVDHEWMTDWNADGFATGSDGREQSLVITRAMS
jgi:1,4-alpha-glucan branching enzyme